MRYIVTQEIKSETKVGKVIYVFDFFFLVVWIMVSYMLAYMVADELHVPFYIFSVIMAIILTMPSFSNKKRRNYQSILLLIKKDRAVYKPVMNISMEIMLASCRKEKENEND